MISIKQRSRGFLLCFLPGCHPPSKDYAKIQTYCSGATVPSQVLIRLAGSERTTPSANEQK